MQVSKCGPSCSNADIRPVLRYKCQAKISQNIGASTRPVAQPLAEPTQPWHSRLQGASLAAIAACTLVAYPLVPSALAVTDTAAVGSCVLRNCQGALAKCLGDAKCLENLVCLQTCSNRPDETECQIKCGDLYADKAVDVFNTCAVSEKKCVPQKVDEGLYPIPTDCALDKAFDLSAFQGRWYITAGLNQLFDTFPCQEHFFATPKGSSGVVFGEINWRIPLSDGDFIPRSTMQRFVQDDSNPAVLYNHDNDYLHYEDDWYVIASKPDEYVFVYYRGSNDAWKGYGGATVYTRANSLPTEYIPELQAAAERAGLDWSKFELTDNTCPAKPPAKSPLQELETDILLAEKFAEKEVAGIAPKLRSFGKGFTMLEEKIVMDVETLEEEIIEELKREQEAAAKLIKRLKMEATMGKWVQSIPLSIREFIMPIM